MKCRTKEVSNKSHEMGFESSARAPSFVENGRRRWIVKGGFRAGTVPDEAEDRPPHAFSASDAHLRTAQRGSKAGMARMCIFTQPPYPLLMHPSRECALVQACALERRFQRTGAPRLGCHSPSPRFGHHGAASTLLRCPATIRSAREIFFRACSLLLSAKVFQAQPERAQQTHDRSTA